LHLGYSVNGKRLLSHASLSKLHTADSRSITDDSGTYSYCFGWRHVASELGEDLAHEGAFGGFYSRIVIVPTKGFVELSVSNELSDAAANAQEAFTNAVLARFVQ